MSLFSEVLRDSANYIDLLFGSYYSKSSSLISIVSISTSIGIALDCAVIEVGFGDWSFF